MATVSSQVDKRARTEWTWPLVSSDFLYNSVCIMAPLPYQSFVAVLAQMQGEECCLCCLLFQTIAHGAPAGLTISEYCVSNLK